MEFDPASREGPPSRHTLESDSEDSDQEGEGQLQSRGSGRAAFAAPTVHVKSQGELQPKPLIVLLGDAGESVAQAVQIEGDEAGTLWVDGRRQGAIVFDSNSSVYVALVKFDAQLLSQQAAYAYVFAALLQRIRPTKLVVIDEYLTTLYMSDEHDASLQQGSHPIRAVRGSTAALPTQPDGKPLPVPFSTPNYLAGPSASLLVEASIAQTPVTALLLPQERSFNPHLQHNLSHLASSSHALNARLAQDRPEESVVRSLVAMLAPAWQTDIVTGAAQTLPITAFVRERRAKAASAQRREQSNISAMYM